MRRIAGRIGGWVAAGVLVAACGGSPPAPADAPTAAPTVAIAATPAPSPTIARRNAARARQHPFRATPTFLPTQRSTADREPQPANC